MLGTVLMMWPAFVSSVPPTGAANAAACDITGTWHGHPAPLRKISPQPIIVKQAGSSLLHFTADGKAGTIQGKAVSWGGLTGELDANTALNASAPPCTRLTWANEGRTFWCKEPWCEQLPSPAPAPGPLPPPPPPTPAPKGAMNVLFIAVDDLRAQYGRSFQTPEVLTPHMDEFFLDGGESLTLVPSLE